MPQNELFQTDLISQYEPVCKHCFHHCVFTVQATHPRLLQHHHEDERPHASSLTAQCSGPHSGPR